MASRGTLSLVRMWPANNIMKLRENDVNKFLKHWMFQVIDVSGLLQLLMFVMSRLSLIPGMPYVFSVMQIFSADKQAGESFRTSPKIRLISVFSLLC